MDEATAPATDPHDRARPVWLVTGANGFLGRHLLGALREERALEAEAEVVAAGRRCPPGWPLARFIETDLVDPWSVAQALRAANPTVVLHLAGRTPPATPTEFYYANTVLTALLLDALRDRGKPVRVVMAGSAAELGPVPESALPVGEAWECRPADPYGLSKWLATSAGLAVGAPLEVMVARVFNPIGPGTPEQQSLGRFAMRLADPSVLDLTVGSLDARRDFVDVRDVARAFIAIALRGRAGLVYHVGTGKSHSVREGLQRLHEFSGCRARVTVDPKFAANAGPRESRADIGRIVEHTGWRPEIAWEQSLRDLWQAARTQPRLPLTA
jgi:GDP-4-dehydro-6-deoxy-D-mannose reductase